MISIPFLFPAFSFFLLNEKKRKKGKGRERKNQPVAQHAISLEAAKLGSQVCLAVSSFIGVGVVAQLLIKEGKTGVRLNDNLMSPQN